MHPRLLIPHVGVRLFLVRRYLRCVQLLTERDRALLYAPVSPRYGFEVRSGCSLYREHQSLHENVTAHHDQLPRS